MAEQHIPPSAHSALTRESSRSSPSRVVGGRWLRQVRRASHSRRSKRSATSPLARSASRHSGHSSHSGRDRDDRVRAEPRRSSRLVSVLPRSDYSITERWSYGADVYETRCDTSHHKSGDADKSTSHAKRKRTCSRDKRRHKSHSSSKKSDECIAHCTRSRTALRSSESACEPFVNSLKEHELSGSPLNQSAPAASLASAAADGSSGLLPLDERDFAYSPFSSSTVTELLDSDYSVYSPTANRRKGKKRKRSTHRSLSHRKSACYLNFEEGRKKIKIDPHSRAGETHREPAADGRASRHDCDKADLATSTQGSCTYLLRNRPYRDLGPPSSTVVSDSTASPSATDALSADRRSAPDARGRTDTPPPFNDLLEASSSKAHSSGSKLLIVPRDLPYLRQTNARRSIAAATGATLGACLTRGAGASQRQRQETSSKRQAGGGESSGGSAGAGGGAAGGRRARARDMPQPQPASTRRDKRGKSSLGSCASAGGASSRSHPQPLTTGAVASTSSTPPASASAASMPDNASSDAKPKSKASSSAEECLGLGGGSGAGAAAGGAAAEESSSEEGEVGRLQALLEARGLPPHLLGALGPRMQHLLHRTVAANSAAASKAAQLLAGLQATGDEGQQLQAVIEMCQLLVMGNEDTLAGFPVRQVVPALVNLLAAEHNFDMMNHACRALTYMLEALPRSSGAVALAVPAFLDKLQAITCMDVAEQSLTALDMLSRRHSKSILQARGVSACLMYLDFFSINAQRAALSITANCCQNLTPDEFHLVRDSLQLLANRLTQQDKKSVECVCLAFSRLVDSFQHDPARLQEIATPELLTNLQQLLVVSPPLISGATFITVLRLLWVMMAACPQLALQLHQRSIADTLLCLLTGSTVHQEQVELLPRLPQELYEITCLIGELMPRLPTDGIFAVDAHLDRPWSAGAERQAHWQWRDDRGVWRSYSWAESRALEAGVAAGEEEVCLTTLGRSYTVDLTAMQQLNDHTGTARPVQRVAPAPPAPDQPGTSSAPATDPRIALVRGNPGLARSLLAVLHEVYWSSAGPAVRSQALKAILRAVYYADAALLGQVLKTQVISSHIAGMMASSDLRIVVGSLQLAEILMQRLPEEMGVQFRREGVLHQVAQLAERPPQPQPPRHAKLKSPSGTSLRSSGSSSPPASTSHTSLDQNNLSLAFSASGSFVANTLPTSSDSGGPEPGPASASTHMQNTSVHRSGSPLQLAEMLKRKRAVKRSSGAGRHARRRDDAPHQPHPPHQPPATSHAAPSTGTPRSSGAGAARSGAAKTTSFLSSLNPSRWGRAPHAHKDAALLAAPHTPPNLTVQNKEKVREWIQWRAARLQREWGALGGGGGALEQLAALAAALPAPAAGAAAPPPALPRQHAALVHLRETLLQHDVSPFEVNHSGILGALLQFLTGEEATTSAATSAEEERDGEGEGRDSAELVAAAEGRLRLFLHVFAELPLVPELAEWTEQGGVSACGALAALVSKVNACVSHLEQFPVRVHDLPARPATSALKFFNTHQLMCDLKRHPSCINLKQWKGGVVRIDPLALVQAIERYLAQRGYATARPRDGSSAAAHSDDDAASDDDVEDSLATPPHHQPTDSDHKLEFLIGDTVLPYNMTVYQAVRQFGEQTDADTDSETPLANAGIWVQTHTIYYRAVEPGEPPRPDAGPQRKGKGQPTKISSRRKPDLLWNEGVVPARDCPLVVMLRQPLLGNGAGAEVRDASLPALGVLRALHALSRHWHTLYRAACLPDHRPLVPNAEFVNAKLAAKANRQLQDPLVIMTGNLPPWLKKIAYACPFVLPFECRHLLFYVVSFDRDRALQRLLEAGGERGGAAGAGADAERVAPRLDRRKRTVQRHNVLRQAEHVMHEFAHSKALLEIQYENEVGTGLGPTLEFYALVSQELQRADLDLWHGSENFKQKPTSFGGEIVKSQPPVVTDRSSSEAAARLASSVRDALNLDEERSPEPSELEKETSIPSPAPDATYVAWPCGLFPQAIGRTARASHLSRVKAKFRFLGKFMAKAVMDSRMVDIPLSVSMYRWMVNEDRWLSLSDVRHVAPELWRSLCRLRRVAERARLISADPRHSAEQRQHLITALELDGCPIEELGLDFILPGDGCTELRRGGRDLPVTAHNLQAYIALVTHWLLYEGVAKQMEAFKEGFESVFPLNNLKIFYPEELEQVFCGSPSGGRDQRWEPRMLADCIRPDHGYTAESRAIRMLIDILASYSRDEQRLFLQFVTGSPRLPTGGFKALNPPLTVVRKSLESSLDPDEYLPSVMTCVNYLKLPDYSSAEVMRAKLRLAASEGQHSFHLS